MYFAATASAAATPTAVTDEQAIAAIQDMAKIMQMPEGASDMTPRALYSQKLGNMERQSVELMMHLNAERYVNVIVDVVVAVGAVAVVVVAIVAASLTPRRSTELPASNRSLRPVGQKWTCMTSSEYCRVTYQSS